MPKYRMNIKFEEEDLKAISKAHQKVVLVKHTGSDSDISVLWISFRPWMLNTVDWENVFAVYVSKSEVESGTTIQKLCDKTVSSGVMYDFKNGAFATQENADMAVDQNTYYIKNLFEASPYITAGLAQSVVVNGQAFPNLPINAVYVPLGQLVAMTPFEQVDVYLLNDIMDSAVITHVYSNKLLVAYGENEVEHTIGYDSKIGQFFIES